MQTFESNTPSETAAQATPAPRSSISAIADVLQERSDPRRYFAVIVSHWWVILLTLLLSTAVGAYIVVTATQRYRAVCRCEILMNEQAQLSASSNSFAPAATPETLARQRSRLSAIITGSTIRNQVGELLSSRYKGIGLNLDVDISVKPVREVESMLDISVDAATSDYAIAYMKELLDQYQTALKNRTLESNQNKLRSLWEEEQRLADEKDAAQKTIQDFQKEHNIQFSEAKRQFDDAFLAGLVQRQNAIRMERTMLEAQFPAIRQANAITIENVLRLTEGTHESIMPTQGINQDNPAGASLATIGRRDTAQGATATAVAATWEQQEELVARLEAEKRDMLLQYKPEHPKMLELDRIIAAAKRELRFGAETAIKRLQARYDALKIQETALEDSAKAWKSELNLSVQDRATYDNKRAELEHLTKLHDQVYARIIDIKAQNADATYNHMVEAPHAVGIVWPNKPLIMLLAILAGLVVGVGIAILLDYLDSSMMDVLAIEQKLGIQYLSSIPNWDSIIPNLDMKNAQVVVDRSKPSVTSEIYRSLRTSLENIMGGKKGYVLAVTSTEANEGKSLTVVNLAVVFAWTGKKVLVVDGDLRRGKLHESFNLKSGPGLTEYLQGSIQDWHSIISPTSHENLSMVMVGSYHHSSPELLDPERIRRLTAEWGKEFDIIVFDTAPIGRVVDSALLGRACDGMLLVTRHGHCTFAGVRHAIHRLEGTKVIGFCLNGIEIGSKRLGYFNYYGYFRRFGRYGHYAYYAQDKYRYGQYGYGPEQKEGDSPAGESEGAKDKTNVSGE